MPLYSPIIYVISPRICEWLQDSLGLFFYSQGEGMAKKNSKSKDASAPIGYENEL
jgi:hypothetical protein